jgi:hypothetical protein
MHVVTHAGIAPVHRVSVACLFSENTDVCENIELLTSLIEARPVLWDKASDIKKDRDGTRKTWKEVCEGINSV